MVEFRACLDRLVTRPVGNDANRRFLEHLANRGPHLFTFLTEQDILATSYHGEQAVRPCAVICKTRGANRTWNGTSTHGVIVSVIATARIYGVDAVDHLAARVRNPDPGLAILLARPPPAGDQPEQTIDSGGRFLLSSAQPKGAE